jgi:small nuclear ribonucleoprotein (snRNP)-like protein
MADQSAARKTLPSLLRHFEGTELTVELKTGRLYRGTLSSADQAMNLTLEDASLLQRLIVNQQHKGAFRRGSSSAAVPSTLSLVHIRGSTIRFIHFPDQLDLTLTIKQGIDRYVFCDFGGYIRLFESIDLPTHTRIVISNVSCKSPLFLYVLVRERAASQKYKRGVRKTVAKS